ncbi:type II secretion system protein [Aurantimonas sp. HBX-1]|uniref:type II secretion system protein n=1 Tax=Aurantimonas sp. HBX-1 TaxID=2906072 RepID=UPI001F40685D|nr:hypothetical protein [Aurantimonas sp. HBX-1]UIJ73897.1 hypothetical protein LXB15_09890 [Aurantimonas sp. HBX-1]
MTSLLEMIVAVAILAGLVSLAPRAVASSRAGIERIEDTVQAQIVAEAVLSVRQRDAALRTGVRSGTMNGLRWMAESRPYLERQKADADSGAPTLIAIRISVEARPGHVVVLEALAVGASQ